MTKHIIPKLNKVVMDKNNETDFFRFTSQLSDTVHYSLGAALVPGVDKGKST